MRQVAVDAGVDPAPEALVSAEPEDLVAWLAPTLQRYLTGRAP